MDTFNIIIDPETGDKIAISDPKAKDILQKYSDISGRTKQIHKDFFNFRQYEFETMNKVVYPFLETVLNKDEIFAYISKHLNCQENENSNMNEIYIKNYTTCFDNFIDHITVLITEYNSLVTKHTPKSIKLNSVSEYLEITE
tara:strand:- start:101 stop:526 length:426 start_codon:yes stop_codon:yes gene_type:complete